MSGMSEQRAYRHPETNRISRTDDEQYALLMGLEPWDGPTEEIEKDKVTGIEYAVINADEPNYRDVQSELRGLGLSTVGTKEVLIQRLAGAKDVPLSTDSDSPGDSVADGDANNESL